MKSLLYIIIVLVVTGCGYSSSVHAQSLDEAERLLLSDPQAAMLKLNQFDVAQFEDSAVMARWALLYSETMVANRLAAPTDTIINIALNYYSAHRLRDEYQRASKIKRLLRTDGNIDQLATALYLQKEKEYMLYRERVNRNYLILATLMILLVAGGIIAWLRQRVKLVSTQHKAMIAEASSLRDDLVKKQSHCDMVTSQLQATLCSRFAVIDDLCQTYYESQGTKVERRAIIDKVKNHIAELQHDEGLFAEMQRSVNECRDNVLDRLRHAMPSIKPEEYRLAVYIACHLSNRTIALLLNESLDVVYKRKSRLKAKIAENTALQPFSSMIF